VSCKLTYQIKTRTSFLFSIGVAETDFQKIESEFYQTSPNTSLEILRIGLCSNRVHRVVCEPGEFTLSYEATVELNSVVQFAPNLQEQLYRELPAEVLPFLTPSRYCESDRLANFAFKHFGRIPHGYGRVRSICDWTHEHLAYVPGATNSLTTACDVVILQQGVCRDFAHLAIALCRGLGIPARYVSGYAIDLNPPDFHGFFEAYLGDNWYLFDATQSAPIGGLVRIAAGHDAADVAFSTILGEATLREKTVSATGISKLDLLNKDPDAIGISTASVAN
jgi:transglutaminase-like putative cysteine protease